MGGPMGGPMDMAPQGRHPGPAPPMDYGYDNYGPEPVIDAYRPAPQHGGMGGMGPVHGAPGPQGRYPPRQPPQVSMIISWTN